MSYCACSAQLLAALVISTFSAAGQAWPSISHVPPGTNASLKSYLAFNKPTKMKVGKQETFEVRIGRNNSHILVSGLSGPGRLEVHSVPAMIEAEMRILADPEEFKIVPSEAITQEISEDQPSSWKWLITPLKSGKRKLRVIANRRTTVEGAERRFKTEEVFNEELEIEVSYWFYTERFVINYWDKLIGLVPIGLLWPQVWANLSSYWFSLMARLPWRRKRHATDDGAAPAKEREASD